MRYSNPIEIPQFVLDYLNSCRAKNPENLAPRTLKRLLTPEIEDWFTLNEVTPGYIWKYFVRFGLNKFSFRLCAECGRRVNLKTILCKPGAQFCSSACASKSSITKQKREQTNIDRYGVACNMSTEEFKKRSAQTLLEKYGDPKYNNVQKAKQTCKERYGFENPFQVPEFKEKSKQTCLEKYGKEYISEVPEFKEKSKQTCLEKYGASSFVRSNTFKKQLRFENFEHFCEMLKKKDITLLNKKTEYIQAPLLSFRCDLCGYQWDSSKTNTQRIFCENCFKQPFSLKEKQVVEYIKSLYNGEIIENDKSVLDGKELDIYLPEKKLAFEFNGNYWHNSEFKDRKYHQEKTLKCQEKSVKLIHIFEYEWDLNCEKIKALIKTSLGVFDRVIYARQCEVKTIDSAIYKKFLDLYHLQGHVNSPIRFGLFFGDELVSVIGFGKSRFKENEFELYRYCVKGGCKVAGGFSKLIKHSKVDNFVSFIDLSHFDGSGYKMLGFKILNVTTPNYVYERNGEVFNRFATQKHKLKILLENFNPELTEEENMINNGWNKIYDAGNIKVQFCS